MSYWPANPNETLRCRGCEQEKHQSEFYRLSSGSYRKTCKDCVRAARRQRYHEQDGIAQVRASNWARYGVTPEDYERMRKEQNDLCAICHQPERVVSKHGTPHGLAIDHDHRTGRVRALLCADCNKVLGFIEKNQQAAALALEYLRQHQQAQGDCG